MPFTDREIAALRPKPERYEVKEPGRTGLGIRVTPRGEKSWTFMYRLNRKQKRMTLGGYPEMSLSKAHKALADAKDKLRGGADPGAELAEVRETERNAETMTDMAAEYIERHTKPNMKPVTAAEEERILNREILPSLGRIKAKDVTRRDLIRILDKISDRGAPVMRNRTASVVSRLFRFAIDRGIVDASPAVSIRRMKEQARERVLTPEEINSLWHGMENLMEPPALTQCVKLMLTTGQRRGEVAGMRWDEIKEDIWRLPGKRTKNRRENIIPLPSLVLGIIDEIRRTGPGPNLSPYLFPGRRAGSHIHPQGLSQFAIRHRAVLAINDATLHDLRRTFATTHGNIGTQAEIISALLNHTPATINGRVYNRATMIEARRRAMERYCEWLQHVIAGDFEAAKKMEGAEVKELTAVA